MKYHILHSGIVWGVSLPVLVKKEPEGLGSCWEGRGCSYLLLTISWLLIKKFLEAYLIRY